jgi:hypothetical protein
MHVPPPPNFVRVSPSGTRRCLACRLCCIFSRKRPASTICTHWQWYVTVRRTQHTLQVCDVRNALSQQSINRYLRAARADDSESEPGDDAPADNAGDAQYDKDVIGADDDDDDTNTNTTTTADPASDTGSARCVTYFRFAFFLRDRRAVTVTSRVVGAARQRRRSCYDSSSVTVCAVRVRRALRATARAACCVRASAAVPSRNRGSFLPSTGGLLLCASSIASPRSPL